MCKTENDISNILSEYHVENNIIQEINILITGHFGNTVSVSIVCPNICILPLYNSTNNIGYILRALVELFDKSEDNSVSLSSLTDIPVRLVFDNKNPYLGKCVGIGHFMKDRFVLIEDLMKLDS